MQGGESDLLKSHAWESEGKTSMRILRRKVGGVADHPLQVLQLAIFLHLDDFLYLQGPNIQMFASAGALTQ